MAGEPASTKGPPSGAPKEGFKEPGLGKVPTTNLFRAVNFELFAKPNRPTMYAGVAAFSLAVGYIIYMRVTEESRKDTYTVVQEDGTFGRHKRTSRWE